MPKVSRQTAAKGGLMTAILGMIGNVVGIGIFFKNKTVFKLNNDNALGVLVAWIISTIIVLFMAISFAEIASAKTKTGKAGIGPWAQTFCGHRFGRYSKLGYALIFWPINTFAVMFFAGEALLNCFAPLLGWGSVSGYDYGPGTTSYIFLIGGVLFAAFMVVNYFKFKSMAKVGKGISFVKFAPIAMVVLIGIIFGAMSGGGLWTQNAAAVSCVDTQALQTANSLTTGFSFIGAISCIPAILFSFEGYVAIDSFKNDLSNPDKQIPLGVVVGVIVIAVLYFAVTIGCITAGTGDVYTLMDKIFGPQGAFPNDAAFKALTMIISIFIFICLIGCVNGMARGGITTYQELCQENVVFKGKALADLKPGNQYFAGAIWFSIIVAIWFIILFIPSAIWNTDAMADGSSTSMIIMLYVIYGALVLCAFMNRFNKHNPIEVKKGKIFPVAAVIGIIGCLFMIGYVGFYQYLYAPIAGGWNNANSTCAAPAGWGMFVSSSNSHIMTNGDIIIWFWVMTAFAALTPVINDALIHWFDKSNKQLLMWQSDKAAVRTISGATVAVAKKPAVKVVKAEKPVKVEKVKPAKVEKPRIAKPVVVKQPKVAKPHPYRPIWISVIVTLVVVALIMMVLTMIA